MEQALEIIRNKKALVISGGGVLGSSAVASLKEFTKLGLDFNDIRSVSGSSVGSIIALAIACNADIEYIENKMNSIDYKKLKNDKCILVEAFHLIKDFGMHDMSEVRNLISEILIDLVGNKDITFKQLFDKTGKWLTITYLSFNYGRTIFADYIYEPNSLVREAVIKSSAIPVFYEAYFEGNRNHREVIVDGGTILNFPMQIPHLQGYKHEDILGLKFISLPNVKVKDEGQPGTEKEWKEGPKNILSYLNILVQILRDQAMKVHVKKDDWKNTVKINVGTLTSIDFNMTDAEKTWLFKQGEIATYKYLEELTNLLKENKYFI